MGIISPTLPTSGQDRGTEEVDVLNVLTALLNLVNGNIDASNITDGTVTATELVTALQQQLGVTGGGTTRRGYAEVLTDEATGSTTPADLATVGPQVAVNVPTNGLVLVKATVDLKAVSAQAQVYLTEDGVSKGQILTTTNSFFTTLSTFPGNTQGVGADWNAGLFVFAATAGTRTYKLQYSRGASGTANFRNRKLWVATMGF